MELKKHPDKEIHRHRPLILQCTLIISMLLVKTAFEWEFNHPLKPINLLRLEKGTPEEEEAFVYNWEMPPPPPPAPEQPEILETDYIEEDSEFICTLPVKWDTILIPPPLFLGRKLLS